MKKTNAISAVLMIALAMTACRKTETPVPAPSVETLAKKGGGTTTATATSSRVYGGQATGLNATIWNTQNFVVTSTQTILAQTPFLPAAGGSLNASNGPASIPGALTADTMYAVTTGQGTNTVSTAFVTNLSLTVGGHTITAGQVQATASASCGPVLSGTAQITSLVVNGTAITVTGAPNQAVYLPGGGFILLNEQSSSKKSGSGTLQVSGMHVIVPNAADVRVATVKADIKC